MSSVSAAVPGLRSMPEAYRVGRVRQCWLPPVPGELEGRPPAFGVWSGVAGAAAVAAAPSGVGFGLGVGCSGGEGLGFWVAFSFDFGVGLGAAVGLLGFGVRSGLLVAAGPLPGFEGGGTPTPGLPCRSFVVAPLWSMACW